MMQALKASKGDIVNLLNCTDLKKDLDKSIDLDDLNTQKSILELSGRVYPRNLWMKRFNPIQIDISYTPYDKAIEVL